MPESSEEHQKSTSLSFTREEVKTWTEESVSVAVGVLPFGSPVTETPRLSGNGARPAVAVAGYGDVTSRALSDNIDRAAARPSVVSA
jgi:hypothetical protein